MSRKGDSCPFLSDLSLFPGGIGRCVVRLASCVRLVVVPAIVVVIVVHGSVVVDGAGRPALLILWVF